MLSPGTEVERADGSFTYLLGSDRYGRDFLSRLMAGSAISLSVAGVDLIQSNRGPLVLEVNSSPGLEGIEKASGIDVADKIIEYLEDEHTNRDKSKPIDI